MSAGCTEFRTWDSQNLLTEALFDPVIDQFVTKKPDLVKVTSEGFLIFSVTTVLFGYYDYHPVTKSTKIGCCDYSQMSF